MTKKDTVVDIGSEDGIARGATIVYIFTVQKDARKVFEHVSREAHRLGRPLTLVSYGIRIPGAKETSTHGAHRIYTIPLQYQ